MLTRREWILGWANLPAAFRDYRECHPWQDEVTFLDLLDEIDLCRSLHKLAGYADKPLKPCWSAVEQLLLHLTEQDQNSRQHPASLP